MIGLDWSGFWVSDCGCFVLFFLFGVRAWNLKLSGVVVCLISCGSWGEFGNDVLQCRFKHKHRTSGLNKLNNQC